MSGSAGGGLSRAGAGILARLPRGRASDLLVLLGLLALATLLRLPDFGTRGPWDTDQGEQMLAIRAIARGQLTLLGPPTSTGGLHHGAVFYYLGALFALPSGGDDPDAVTFGIVLGGIATVGFTWWLARAAAGPRGAAVAGLVAGLLAAVSAQMVDASVRLWNPAFVAPAAAFALAAAVEGHRRRDPRWWVPVAVGFVLAGQSHVLAWVLAVPLGVFALAELRRTGRRAVPWLVVAAAIVAVSFVPLLVNELTTGFSELRALVRARGGAADDAPDLGVRLGFVPLRILAIPLVGDINRALAVIPAGVAVVVGAAVLAIRDRAAGGGGDAEGGGLRAAPAAALLAAGLVLGAVVLALGAPWLATVTPLYVDHYHLALDQLVFALVGLGAATLWTRGRGPAGAPGAGGRGRGAGRALAATVVAAIVGWNLVAVPLPAVNADGGWPAGLAAGRRVVDRLGGAGALVVGVPRFKKTTAVDYPMTILGSPPASAGAATRVVVLCDRLFEEVVGSACLGPAEAARLGEVGVVPGRLVDRFEAAPGRWISTYEIAGR